MARVALWRLVRQSDGSTLHPLPGRLGLATKGFLFAESFQTTIDFTDCFRIAQHPRVERNSVLASRAIIAGHKVERFRSAAAGRSPDVGSSAWLGSVFIFLSMVGDQYAIRTPERLEAAAAEVSASRWTQHSWGAS